LEWRRTTRQPPPLHAFQLQAAQKVAVLARGGGVQLVDLWQRWARGRMARAVWVWGQWKVARQKGQVVGMHDSGADAGRAPRAGCRIELSSRKRVGLGGSSGGGGGGGGGGASLRSPSAVLREGVGQVQWSARGRRASVEADQGQDARSLDSSFSIDGLTAIVGDVVNA
jgi:hypothetical protein